ncbi:hypothetical protein V8F33_002186 [Rhypophila sp. PSN 637]
MILLRSVRDRYLKTEVRSNQSDDARYLLEDLMKEKAKYHQLDEFDTIRVIRDVQIRQGMMDAAVKSLKEIIEVNKEKMSTLPFSRPSVFDEKVRKREGGNDTTVLNLSSVPLAACCPNIDWNFC